MPVSIFTADESAAYFARLELEIVGLTTRVEALEATKPPGTGEPPDKPDPGTMQATLVLGSDSFTFSEADAEDIGAYVDPDGRFTMSCKRATHPGIADFSVDFRRIDGWSCIVFDYGNGLATTEPVNLPAHTVTITNNDEDANYTDVIDLPAHYHAARWRWQSGPWPHMRDVDDLIARNWLPRLDPAVHKGTAKPLPVPVYTPMGLAGLTADMPATGGRADIGFTTDWQGEFLCTRSPDMLAGVLAQGEAGGTISWHFRDPATGALLDLMNTWRFASCYWTSSVNPYIYPAQGTGIKIDVSHMPACAWVPFALTGDPFFLETQQAMANYAFLDSPRSWEWVWQMPGSGQTRAMAWNLRTIAQALAGTPDEVPPWLLPKSVIRQMLGQCVKGLDCVMNEGGTNRTALNCIDVGLPGFDNWNQYGMYPKSCFNHPWQTSFFCQSAAFAATLHPELKPVAGYVAKNIIARTKGAVWDSSFPADYCLLLRPSYEAPWFANWEECWAANAPLLGVPVAPCAHQLTVVGDYHGGVYAGLSALAHARKAGVAEIPEEVDATLERYAGQMSALLGGNNWLTWNNSYARP